jgi:hypothetical protein
MDANLQSSDLLETRPVLLCHDGRYLGGPNRWVLQTCVFRMCLNWDGSLYSGRHGLAPLRNVSYQDW